MGIGFVLLIWALLGGLGAGIGALFLGTVAAYLTRGVSAGRKRLILAASLYPFACLAWLGAVFAAQGLANELFLHRDSGLGDLWKCPLPNGYALLMIDTTEQGFVYNPKTQPDEPIEGGSDAVGRVAALQVADSYIFGSRASSQEQNTDPYFLLNTSDGSLTTFSAYERMQARAESLGIKLSLEPIAVVYRRYRFTWLDACAAALSVFVPLLGAVYLWRRTLQLRRSAAQA